MTRTLLQQALDALHPQANRAFVEATKDALRYALAAPQPEPVALCDALRWSGAKESHGAMMFSPEQLRKFYEFASAPPAAPAPAVPDLKHKPTVQRLMDLARKFRATPGDLYDGAYKELQQACYEALSAVPDGLKPVGYTHPFYLQVKQIGGFSCQYESFGLFTAPLYAAPAVREPQDERIRWRDAVIKEAESALRTAEQEFADMPTWANVGHAAKKVTHALAVIAALGIGGGGNG